MLTVSEVSRKTGVSVRALHHYDRIGLLKPTQVTEAGYRLYDDEALERLQCILLYRELEFPLKDIREILDSPDYDRNRALDQQVALLEMRKEHLENLITLARGIQRIGVKSLSFDVFDTKKIDEYAAQAKASWGKTSAYREFEEKSRERSREQEDRIGRGLMDILAGFGGMQHLAPADEAVQAQVTRLQEYITEHYYNCTPEILSSLGAMYAGGGSMTENINKAGGEGTAEFAAKAIEVRSRKN